MNPFFSIIIPVYNVAPWLRECLDSVLKQNYCNWEAICVDDGSTDDSGRILDEYAAKDARFVVFHKENGGVGAARNVALDHVRGDWVLFVDSDDLIHPNLISTIESIIETYHPQLISFKHISFEEHQHPEWEESTKFHAKNIDTTHVIESVHLTVCFWAKAYSRQILNGKRFTDYKHGEDTIFLVQCLLSVNNVLDVDVKLYAYRRRGGSACRTRKSTLLGIEQTLNRSLFALGIVSSSGKTLTGKAFKYRCELLTVNAICEILRLERRDRSAGWRLWYDYLDAIYEAAKSNISYHIGLSLCMIIRHPVVPMLIYVVPYKFKQMCLRVVMMFRGRHQECKA